MSRTRYRFGEAAYPHFVTCTIVGWQPVFTRPDLVEIVLDSWRFLHQQERMSLLGYVIMENHLHLIGASENLAKEIGDFKSFTARRIVDRLHQTGSSRNTRSSAISQAAAQNRPGASALAGGEPSADDRGRSHAVAETGVHT